MKRILFRPQAVRDLERLPNRDRDQVEEAIERFAQTGFGDIKMLVGEGRQLRLRVGDWRIRFVYEKPDIIRILHVRNSVAAQEGGARSRQYGRDYRRARQARMGRPRSVPQLTPAPLARTSPSSTARPGEKCWPPSRKVPRRNIERPAMIPRRRSRNPITGRNDSAK